MILEKWHKVWEKSDTNTGKQCESTGDARGYSVQGQGECRKVIGFVLYEPG